LATIRGLESLESCIPHKVIAAFSSEKRVKTVILSNWYSPEGVGVTIGRNNVVGGG
jgi:hypothetical protein